MSENGASSSSNVKHFERSLGFFSVVAISVSAMLGSGIFVIPGLAAAKTGPTVWLAYLVAGICAFPAALSKAELATAMPESGGTYVYIDRAFGPLMGTIGGLGLWLSLLLKSSFALIGFGAYLSVFADLPLKPTALFMLLGIVVLNLVGIKKVGRFQLVVIIIAVLSLGAMVIMGLPQIDPSFFDKPQLPNGFQGLFAAAAFVFVSYAGVTKAAAVAEEVKNPGRNLPLGILVSLVTVMIVYALVVLTMAAYIPQEQFYASSKPVYDLALGLGGPIVGTLGAVLGVLTMTSMATAGLLASSRFPFAMSRDNLLPKFINAVGVKFGTPHNAVILTGLTIGASIVFFDVEKLAKLASAFVIMIYVLENITVIVLRESFAQWYKPSYRAPLYPLTQILGALSGLGLLAVMALNALIAFLGVGALGLILYFFYGRKRTSRIGELGKISPKREFSGEAQSRDSSKPPDGKSGHLVAVSLFGNERSPEAIVEMGIALSKDRELLVKHISEVQDRFFVEDPERTLDPALRSLRRRLFAMAEDKSIDIVFDPIVSRDVNETIHSDSSTPGREFIVMAWGGRAYKGRLLRNSLAWIVGHVNCNFALFKDAGIRYIRKIMVYATPGPHDALVVATADHLAMQYNAVITFVHYQAEDESETRLQSRIDYLDELKHLCESKTKIRVLPGKNLMAAIKEETTYHDLLVLGAPPEKGISKFFLKSEEDQLTEVATCSVLRLKTPRLKTHSSYKSKENVLDEQKMPVITRCLADDYIGTNLEQTKKEALFHHFAKSLAPAVDGHSADEIESALWEREKTQNTSVGHGLALPHATLGALSKTILTVFTTAKAVDYGTSGKDAVDVFIVTLGPPSERQLHLELLSNVAQLVLETQTLEDLRAAKSRSEAIVAIESGIAAVQKSKNKS